MRELRISKRADPAYVKAFASLVAKLAAAAKNRDRLPAEPITMYLAGGAAMHFYTGNRISNDVDAVFSAKLLAPADLVAIYRDSQGKPRSVYFDAAYNESYALLHEDAPHDAMRLSLDGIPETIRVFVLKPVDLAVSKLSRFSAIDRQDIIELAGNGLVTARELRKRAEAALPGYVGDPASVRTSIELACRDLKRIERR